jgi:plasmid stabilization system protein ParE
MGKKSRTQSRRKPPAAKKHVHHPDLFFARHPELRRLREVMEKQGPSLLDELGNLARYDACRRHIVRFAVRSAIPEEIMWTDDRSGAAIFGFSSATEIQQNLFEVAKVRTGDLWSVACLVIPINPEGVEPIFALALCDDQGGFAVCMCLNKTMRWDTVDSPSTASMLRVEDPQHDPYFFEDVAARVIAEFPSLSETAPHAHALIADRLRREIRVLADADALEFSRVTELMSDEATEWRENFARAQEKVAALEVELVKAKKQQAAIELERQSAANARARSETLERELRQLRQTPRAATSVDEVSNGLKAAVDRLLGL